MAAITKYVLIVTKKSRLWRGSENKKLKKKTNFSTGTFRDTASVAPRERERTLCLGPVVLHLYISHWSRV